MARAIFFGTPYNLTVKHVRSGANQAFAAFDRYKWGDPFYAQFFGTDAQAYGHQSARSALLAMHTAPQAIYPALRVTDKTSPAVAAGGSVVPQIVGSPVQPPGPIPSNPSMQPPAGSRPNYPAPPAMDNSPQQGGGPYDALNMGHFFRGRQIRPPAPRP